MSMTTVFYESIEDEEILFQPQGMKVQHVDMKTEQINKLELHEQWMEQTKKQYAEEILRAETRTHTEKVEDYAECVKQSKIAKEAYTQVKPNDIDYPKNFQMLMMLCNM